MSHQDHFARLRRQASAGRAETPAIISALSELGVTSKVIAEAIGISPTSYSFWKTGLQSLPEKHKPALLDLARQAQRILQESAHTSANRIKLARAEGFIRIAEAEANHEPR